MRLSRRTNTIILWVISIGLLLGMIITFTPTIGGFGGSASNEGETVLLVNGEPISELDVARARQNTLFSSVTEGQVGEDLELLLVEQLVNQEVFDQAAARTRVSGREVRAEVETFRESQGVAGRRNDQAYLQVIGRSGFDDQSFRAYIEEQLRRSEYEESLIEEVEVSDAEVETFYLANTDQYRSDERILARAIVVEDAQLAAELRERALAGEDFADLASENSVERADRGGALGAPQGSTEPQPVGRAALPQDVSAAAFALPGPGLTEVVESGQRAYLVQVEEHVPASLRPLDEVEEQVRADALAAQEAGVVQRHLEELSSQANVEVPEGSDIEYDDYAVARVGDEEILASDLALATYSNQQIQQNLNPQLAPLIVEFFKPTILETMIDRKLAYLGAEQLEADFVGSEAQVAEQALAFVSRDASVDEEAIDEYYQANARLFTIPAQADALRVEFGSQQAAEAFRSAALEGSEIEAAAEEQSGAMSELGTVREGQLEEALDRALFATDAFESLPDDEREVSDVLVLESEQPEGSEVDEGDAAADGEADDAAADEVAADDVAADEVAANDEAAADGPFGRKETFVVLVANRTPEQLRPLSEVRDQVEQAVLQAERAELSQQWLAGLREAIEVVNLLAQAQEEAATEAATEADAAGETEEPAAGAGSEDAAAEAEAAPASEGEAEGEGGAEVQDEGEPEPVTD
ncbi:MAG: peptidyl-prolyl cis-trans isomerase [Trueperaceae bacterium]